MPATKNLNIIAPIGFTGYGIAAANLSLALKKLDYKIALFPIGTVQCEPQHEKVFAEMQADAGQFDTNSSCLRIWHQNNMAEFVGNGPHIAFPFFELDTFNAREKHHLDSVDVIFTTSKWGKDVIVNNIGREDDIEIVPLGVDREIFHQEVKSDGLGEDYTTFLNIGKWEVRKGHDFLLNAFNNAFIPSDKVTLKMLCDNPFIGQAGNNHWRSQYLNSKMGPNIQILDRVKDHSGVARVIADADCGVFPARAEGWNLELLECLSMGKQVIATHNTAQREYLSNKNAHLIVCDEMEPAIDGIWFHGQGNWPKLGDDQMEQTVHHMRKVHVAKQLGALSANEHGISIAKEFTWDEAAKKMDAILSAVGFY